MFFSQVEHLIKMANDHESNMTWFITLCIYLLPICPPIYLITYLPTYYLPTHPPTYLLFTYLPILSHLPIYICTYPCFSLSYDLPICLPTYLHIIYLPIHPFTYLILTTRRNHYV
jgi:hypothetical protein